MTRRLPWLLVAAVLLVSAIALQTLALRQRPQRELPAVLYLQAPAVARRVALSFDMLAADLYWMRALQHFGATRLRTCGPRTFENLYPFLDLATSLDPRFVVAYRFGAIFLSEAPPGGPGRPDLAVPCSRKASRPPPIAGNIFRTSVSLCTTRWTGDYAKAAEAFSKGPPFRFALVAPVVAAVTLTEGGDRQTSRLLWRALSQTAENDWLRRDAQRRLVQLDALDQVDQLQGLVARARLAGLTAPWSWVQLLQARTDHHPDRSNWGSLHDRHDDRACRRRATIAPMAAADLNPRACQADGRPFRDARGNGRGPAWCARAAGRQLSERLHLPVASRFGVSGVPGLALSVVRASAAAVVPQRAGGELVDAPRPLRLLPRADSLALSTGRVAQCRSLGPAWPAVRVGAAAARLVLFASALLVLFFTDLDCRILPNQHGSAAPPPD